VLEEVCYKDVGVALRGDQFVTFVLLIKQSWRSLCFSFAIWRLGLDVRMRQGDWVRFLRHRCSICRSAFNADTVATGKE
jgi:hypothetical protein